MHASEPDIDADLVRKLLESQFPEWTGLDLRESRPWGTDNAMFRLGDTFAVRLPRVPAAAEAVVKEHCWLPGFAMLLPLAVPEPLALGEPAFGYPHPWTVCRWLPGTSAVGAVALDSRKVARQVAGMLAALRAMDVTGGPLPGAHNSHRGVPVRVRDGMVREWLPKLDGLADIDRLTRAWDAVLDAPDWDGPPSWLHGDMHASNLIVAGDELAGVIDWGCMGVGDPATDLIPAWSVLDADGRQILREQFDIDDATWMRGMGWAHSMAVSAWPYYRTTNPTLVAVSQRIVAEVLSEFG